MAKMERNQGDDVLDGMFMPGMFVKRINHNQKALRYKFTGPYIVDEVLDNSLYKLKLPNGQIMESPIHQDDLRHYGSKDTSQFYHGNKIVNTNDDREDEGIMESAMPASSEGRVVTLPDDMATLQDL
jgi:hypothetical protein